MSCMSASKPDIDTGVWEQISFFYCEHRLIPPIRAFLTGQCHISNMSHLKPFFVDISFRLLPQA